MDKKSKFPCFNLGLFCQENMTIINRDENGENTATRRRACTSSISQQLRLHCAMCSQIVTAKSGWVLPKISRLPICNYRKDA